jgi:hypothetical protein
VRLVQRHELVAGQREVEWNGEAVRDYGAVCFVSVIVLRNCMAESAAGDCARAFNPAFTSSGFDFIY